MENKHIQFNIKNEIATLCFDTQNEKVNTLSSEVLKELQQLLKEINNNHSIKALLITSAKNNNFIAGANIHEIKSMTNIDEIYEVLQSVNTLFMQLQKLPYPTIAVINGSCMGGGLELALCCDYRIATSDTTTKISFPEIKLGIFPGFGGTARLPKLVGLVNALDLILTGKIINTKKAFKIGLIDRYFSSGHLESQTKIFIKNILNNTIPHRKKPFRFIEYFALTRAIIFNKATKNLNTKVHPNFKGPHTALDVIKSSFGDTLENAIEKESRAFSSLAITPESKNLIDLFFTSENIKKDFSYINFNKKIEKTAIIGSGVMGKGIIWLFSKYMKDIRVKIRDIQQVQAIIYSTQKLYQFFIKTRKMTKKQVEFKLNKISYTDKFNGLKMIDLALEAIIENSTQKEQTYKNLEDNVSKECIIATNTSSISINSLAQGINNKERFIGIHFFNPVNKMSLVEVIPSQYTSQEVIAKSFEFLRRCNKIPILVGDCAGFLVNRVLIPYINEAAFILEDKNDIALIDNTLKEFGMPMGPFTLADIVGIDVGFKVSNILHAAYGERMKVSTVLTMIHDDLQLLGQKGGKGFYLYTNKNEIVVNEDIKKSLNNQQKDISKEDITNRAIFIMINEASRCLEEGIIKKASYLDFAMIAGTGFPAFRGGVLKYADTLGIEYIIDTLEQYKDLFGERFTPSNLLYKLKEHNKTFYTGEELWSC